MSRRSRSASSHSSTATADPLTWVTSGTRTGMASVFSSRIPAASVPASTATRTPAMSSGGGCDAGTATTTRVVA